MKNNSSRSASTRVKNALSGLIIISIGIILLLKQLGYVFPDWLFTWPMIVIVTGLIAGAGSLYSLRKDLAWLIITLVGLVFLINRIYPAFQLTRYIWPGVIIAFGLWLVFGTRRMWKSRNWNTGSQITSVGGEPILYSSSDEVIEDVSVFGTIRKNILAKNFRGGEVVTLFGNVELNLMHADIQGPIKLEVVQVFGGTKLIVPSSWEVVSDEMVAVFGNIDAKRMQTHTVSDSNKKLIITGVSVFANFEVRSYA